MISGRPRWRAVVATGCAGVVLLAGCARQVDGHGRPGTGGGVPGASPRPAACPASYRAPDTDRPSVALTFTVSTDLATVTGTEHVTFTPDRPINELVFRLTANTKPTVATGAKIVVTSAHADHGAGAARYGSDGADPSTQGGLLRLPFATEVAAGTTVTADLAFTLTLGGQSFDRFGRSGGYAWFASAQPVLAWERGYGWHTEPMLQFPAESATSEAMRTDLTVTAPEALTVIMSGDPRAGTAPIRGSRTWHASLDAARDVSVSVGPYVVSDTQVSGIRLRVGAPSAEARDRLVPEFVRAITELARRFGPFPFPSLSVARPPVQGGGIEYPAAILMLDDSQLVAVHETAHQWFYAMVGNSQAEHAWLDEAFASYAEQLVDGDAPPPRTVDEPGQVDRPTADYGDDEQGYYEVTYDKGAAALHAARAAAGASAFDAAVRCYVTANAWRVADPADLESALHGLPSALAVLRRAHAVP